MKYLFSIFTILFISTELVGQTFDEKTTTSSNVRLNVTNSGTYGNAFRGYKKATVDRV